MSLPLVLTVACKGLHGSLHCLEALIDVIEAGGHIGAHLLVAPVDGNKFAIDVAKDMEEQGLQAVDVLCETLNHSVDGLTLGSCC
ncbi:hypothetical protein BDN71DRAFT_1442348 [Pleurotus eryngii]|uniref:Uncharacterized protein n=1 Tax=Pleurotus eryngii TaxID=5323 RepID=A0A9P6A455_PLEER|nr:hypothetical protein BDN71DRAFT_1442348 [Pleurotus eryngii]